MLGELPKDYRRRLTASGIAALLIHSGALLLIGLIGLVDRDEPMDLASLQEPMTISFEPEDRPRQIIETSESTDEDVDPDTDLISDRDTQASDPFDVEGERTVPFFEDPSDFDDPGGAPAPPMIEPPVPDPESRPEPDPMVEQEPSEESVGDSESAAEPDPAPVPDAEETQPEIRATPDAPDEAESELPEVPEERTTPERREVAQLEPQDTPLPTLPEADRPQPPRGRVDGGVRGQGLLGFEAKHDELAPYLLHIRRKVEARWHTAIEMQYSGTMATKAVMDCVISADGSLVSVSIVDPGDSPTYAAICREAIEKAAPFDPFPIDVPDIYRNRNIEIRWTFSFFM